MLTEQTLLYPLDTVAVERPQSQWCDPEASAMVVLSGDPSGDGQAIEIRELCPILHGLSFVRPDQDIF